jgi:hypothetical protein
MRRRGCSSETVTGQTQQVRGVRAERGPCEPSRGRRRVTRAGPCLGCVTANTCECPKTAEVESGAASAGGFLGLSSC